MWYELKLKVNIPDEKTGEYKTKKEHYICNVDLFCECEAKGLALYDHKGASVDVFAISRSNVYEIINEADKDDGNDFYRATIVAIFIDDNGKEKVTTYNVLIASDNITDATAQANEYMKQGLQDMRLEGIKQTKIKAVI